MERFPKEHPSSMKDAEVADPSHRSGSQSDPQLHTQALRPPPAARQHGTSQHQQVQQMPGSKQSEKDRLLAKGPGKSGESQVEDLPLTQQHAPVRAPKTCCNPNDTGAATSAYVHPQQASGALSEPGHESNLDPGKLVHASKSPAKAEPNQPRHRVRGEEDEKEVGEKVVMGEEGEVEVMEERLTDLPPHPNQP